MTSPAFCSVPIPYVGLRLYQVFRYIGTFLTLAFAPLASYGLSSTFDLWREVLFLPLDFGVIFVTSDFACILQSPYSLRWASLVSGFLSIQRHISYVGLRASYGLSRVSCVGARTACLRLGWKAPKTGIEPVSPPAGQGNHNHKAKSAFQ